MKEYNKSPLPEKDENGHKLFDPRQCLYIEYHTAEYGSQNLLINGETYEERCAKNRPSEEAIKEKLKGYEDREAYLWNNLRGWAIVFRTEKNETMFKWDELEKVN